MCVLRLFFALAILLAIEMTDAIFSRLNHGARKSRKKSHFILSFISCCHQLLKISPCSVFPVQNFEIMTMTYSKTLLLFLQVPIATRWRPIVLPLTAVPTEDLASERMCVNAPPVTPVQDARI